MKQGMMPRYSALAMSTVQSLIEALHHFPKDAIVLAYDGNSEQEEEVTGILFEARENHETGKMETIVHICTDDNS